jgi:hypothetical protein
MTPIISLVERIQMSRIQNDVWWMSRYVKGGITNYNIRAQTIYKQTLAEYGMSTNENVNTSVKHTNSLYICEHEACHSCQTFLFTEIIQTDLILLHNFLHLQMYDFLKLELLFLIVLLNKNKN